MASSTITLWQIDGETMETVTDIIFLGPKITADGDWSHEIKRYLLLGIKAITNLDSILKSRDITLLTKICLVIAMAFPVVMYGCESWTVKKAECWIDAFELWCWRRLLRLPWTTRRSNQSVLKEINPDYSLEGLMLKLKVLSFGHLMWRADSLGKDAGKDWRQEEKGTTEHEMLDGISSSMNVSLSKPQEWWWTGKPDMLQSRVKHERVTEFNWTEYYSVGFSDEQTVKNLSAMQETQVQPLGQENPLEKEWLPCILPLRIPWTGKPGRLQSMGLQSHTLSN